MHDPLRAAMLLAMESYDTVVAELLGLRALSALDADRAVRALLMPAFTDDVAITAWTRRDGAWLEVRALSAAARPAVMEMLGVRSVSLGRWIVGADGKHRKVAPEPPPAVDPADLRPRSVELPVGALESEALWERLDAIDREALRAPRNWGLDGISIKATFLELDDSMESFEMWSPARQTAGGELVAALLDLACPRIPESPLAATMVRIGARMR